MTNCAVGKGGNTVHSTGGDVIHNHPGITPPDSVSAELVMALSCHNPSKFSDLVIGLDWGGYVLVCD